MHTRIRTLAAIAFLIPAVLVAQTFTQIAPLPTQSNLWGVSFTSANNGFIAGEGHTLFKTTNGGDTWTKIILPGYEDGPFYNVTFSTPTLGFVSGNSAVGSKDIFRTIDGGVTWDQVQSCPTPVVASANTHAATPIKRRANPAFTLISPRVAAAVEIIKNRFIALSLLGRKRACLCSLPRGALIRDLIQRKINRQLRSIASSANRIHRDSVSLLGLPSHCGKRCLGGRYRMRRRQEENSRYAGPNQALERGKYAT